MQTAKVANGTELGKALIESGAVPQNCRRVIIDSGPDPTSGTWKMYCECFVDEKILDVLLEAKVAQ